MSMSKDAAGDAADFCCDNIEEWLESLEARSGHSPLAYFVLGEDHQRALKELCQHYVDASKRQRGLIRDAVRDKRGILNQLMGYVYKSAEHVRTTKDVSWLRIGATAAVIQGGRLDQRDYLLTLAELYVSAEEAGLDPEAAFEAVGGGLPAGFHTSAVVRGRRAR